MSTDEPRRPEGGAEDLSWQPGAGRPDRDEAAPAAAAGDDVAEAPGELREGDGEDGREDALAATAGEEAGDGPRRRIRALPVIAVVLSVLTLVSLFWIAGEMHYQSCIQKASVRTQGSNDDLTRLVRLREVNACSRSPF
jgi:hypothetical protein